MAQARRTWGVACHTRDVQHARHSTEGGACSISCHDIANNRTRRSARNLLNANRAVLHAGRCCAHGTGERPGAGHLVVEVAVQAQDVGVAQVRLDLDLAPQLVLHLILLQLRLVQGLRVQRTPTCQSCCAL